MLVLNFHFSQAFKQKQVSPINKNKSLNNGPFTTFSNPICSILEFNVNILSLFSIAATILISLHSVDQNSTRSSRSASLPHCDHASLGKSAMLVQVSLRKSTTL